MDKRKKTTKKKQTMKIFSKEIQNINPTRGRKTVMEKTNET